MDRNIMAKVEATWAERLKAQGLGGRNGRATQRLLTAQADFFAGAMSMHYAMAAPDAPHGDSMPPAWVVMIMSSRIIGQETK